MDLYRCTKCNQMKTREDFHEKSQSHNRHLIQSACRQCRLNEYGKRKYTNTCRVCDLHRKLNNNGACGPCNAERGLKQCRKCGDLLPLHLGFYKGRATCVTCYNG